MVSPPAPAGVREPVAVSGASPRKKAEKQRRARLREGRQGDTVGPNRLTEFLGRAVTPLPDWGSATRIRRLRREKATSMGDENPCEAQGRARSASPVPKRAVAPKNASNGLVRLAGLRAQGLLAVQPKAKRTAGCPKPDAVAPEPVPHPSPLPSGRRVRGPTATAPANPALTPTASATAGQAAAPATALRPRAASDPPPPPRVRHRDTIVNYSRHRPQPGERGDPESDGPWPHTKTITPFHSSVDAGGTEFAVWL